MNLEQKVKTTKFVLDLTRLDTSLSDPSLLSLLSDGWEVFSSVPVEDNGPKVILFLKESKDKLVIEKLSIIDYLNSVLLIFIVIALVSILITNISS